MIINREVKCLTNNQTVTSISCNQTVINQINMSWNFFYLRKPKVCGLVLLLRPESKTLIHCKRKKIETSLPSDKKIISVDQLHWWGSPPSTVGRVIGLWTTIRAASKDCCGHRTIHRFQNAQMHKYTCTSTKNRQIGTLWKQKHTVHWIKKHVVQECNVSVNCVTRWFPLSPSDKTTAQTRSVA